MTNWKDELDKVQQCPQRQDSLGNQLADLTVIADKFGFYDATDYIKRVLVDRFVELLLEETRSKKEA